MTGRLKPWDYASLSPMERTLRWMEAHGWHAEVMERWIPGARIRKDVFCCDVLAARADAGVAIVQVCDGSSFAAHVEKVSEDEGAREFVAAGGECLIVGWRKLKAAGGWCPRIWRVSEGRELELDEVLEDVEWQPRLVTA